MTDKKNRQTKFFGYWMDADTASFLWNKMRRLFKTASKPLLAKILAHHAEQWKEL